MIDRCRRYWRLSRTEQQVFLASVALLPILALATKVCGFAATQRWLSHLGVACEIGGADHESTTLLVVRMVRAAARYDPWRASCLQRSLLLWWLLRRRGIASDLRIGVRRTDEGFQAHAWVECGGRVLNDSEEVRQRFTAFDRPIIPVSVESVK